MLAFSVCRASFGVHVSRHRHAGAADLPSKCQSLRQHLPLAGHGVYLGLGGGTGWGNNAYTKPRPAWDYQRMIRPIDQGRYRR
jgi:hypothetical protein